MPTFGECYWCIGGMALAKFIGPPGVIGFVVGVVGLVFAYLILWCMRWCWKRYRCIVQRLFDTATPPLS
jgi:hypothetical protein